MNWYSTYKNEWREIIETVSNETRRSPFMIEKDIIQSMFLFELNKSGIPFVFKGGTSLSKVYDLIDRFSEDIDLSFAVKPSDSEKRKSNHIILTIADKLGLFLNNSEQIKSRYDYNKYVFKYDSLFSDISLEIIVETNFYLPVYPVEEKMVNSFVGIFCSKNNITMPIPFESMNFVMPVQSLERTFVDKVFAVCDYRVKNMWDRDSRHLYDIAKILNHIQYGDELSDLIIKVRKDRMNSRNNPSAQPEFNINDLLKDIIDNKYFEEDYTNLTSKLLYEEYDYNKAIDNGIKKVLALRLFECDSINN